MLLQKEDGAGRQNDCAVPIFVVLMSTSQFSQFRNRPHFLKELNLVITYNHRHHVAAAISRECSDNILFHGPVLSQEIAASPIYATSDFHFADKEGNIIKENSDPRLVLCCLLAEQAIAFKSGNMNHQIKNSII